MKKGNGLTTMTACLVALLGVGAVAYLDKPAVVANDKERFEFGAEIEHPFGEKSVKGAPFAAQVTLEQTQTLANGVHVSRKMTGALYRDSEGRTRQELPRDGAPEVVLINDNVAGVFYNLHMFQRTVTKINASETRVKLELAERGNREREEREQMEKAKSGNIETARRKIEPERTVESLGAQAIEGVQSEGKRFTLTIPTGMEGNDQPFDIVSERWYSPELQIVVMSKRSDPRTGDVVYRLANINRSEPSHSLFEAPADFTVNEEKIELRKKEKD